MFSHCNIIQKLNVFQLFSFVEMVAACLSISELKPGCRTWAVDSVFFFFLSLQPHGYIIMIRPRQYLPHREGFPPLNHTINDIFHHFCAPRLVPCLHSFDQNSNSVNEQKNFAAKHDKINLVLTDKRHISANRETVKSVLADFCFLTCNQPWFVHQQSNKTGTFSSVWARLVFWS